MAFGCCSSCAPPVFTKSPLRSSAKRPKHFRRRGRLMHDNFMPKPLLYRPPPRWHVWAALGGAALIHIGAVVAAMKHEKPPPDLSDIPTFSIEATIEQPTEQPTPPPEDIPLPEPPPMPQEVPEFHEEATPPPKPRQQA